MRYIFAMQVLRRSVIGFFFALSVFAFTLPEAEWRTYTYRSGNFRVSLPGTPETRKERVMTIKAKAEGTYYMVSFNQLEEPATNQDDIREALRAGAQRYARNLNAEVEQRRSTTLNGLPARELRLKSANGVYIWYRIAVSQDRIYQLSVMSALEYPSEENALRFYESFELLSR